MFVMNCRVDTTQKLKYSLSKSARKKSKLKKKEEEDEGEDYNPVKCETCGTEVAVYDKDEIYHFFNVIPSHA